MLKQPLYMQKEETSSSAITVESFFILATMDAYKAWDTAKADIPGAFMQADMVGNAHVRLEGRLAEFFTKLYPKLYNEYLYNQDGKPNMYVKLKICFMVNSRLQCSSEST